jgi:3-methyladenine DNA glycosylase AlkD
LPTKLRADAESIVALLKQKADAKYLAGMLRFGIDNQNALGVKIPEVRKIAKALKRTTNWRSSFGPPASTRRASWPQWWMTRQRLPKSK